MFDTYKDARYNQDDILEWRACDRLGNEVLCYWNGRTELHIKAPYCECGAQLEYVHTDSNCVCGISSDDYQSFLYGLMD